MVHKTRQGEAALVRGPLLNSARLQPAGCFKGKQRKKIGVLNMFSRIIGGRCKKMTESAKYLGNFCTLH